MWYPGRAIINPLRYQIALALHSKWPNIDYFKIYNIISIRTYEQIIIPLAYKYMYHILNFFSFETRAIIRLCGAYLSLCYIKFYNF